MTAETKQQIDGMSYESLLRRWRNSAVGDPIFTGESGEYYAKVMAAARDAVGHEAAVAASKYIGWD